MTTGATMTPAGVLRQAADWFAEDPTRWGKKFFINPVDGCRCALGGVAQVIAPRDLDGDPTKLLDYESTELGLWVADFLADYLVDQFSVPVAESVVPGDGAVETIANWNDEEERDAIDVIVVLRAAADEWDARQAARLARAS
jgi:hypothetical protein